jgi:hypothetical protein
MHGQFGCRELPLEGAAVAPETIVGDFIALTAHPLRQALVVAEAILKQAALDLLPNVSWQHDYYV